VPKKDQKVKYEQNDIIDSSPSSTMQTQDFLDVFHWGNIYVVWQNAEDVASPTPERGVLHRVHKK